MDALAGSIPINDKKLKKNKSNIPKNNERKIWNY